MCIGSLDGKHVRIKPPSNSGSLFYNYKHTFSVVLMALVDANYKFIYCDVGCNGRVSDGGLFGKCSLNKALQENLLNLPNPQAMPGLSEPLSYHMLADEAFPLRNDLLKPYPARHLTKEQRIFNYRLSRARRVVENAFGILSNRFRVFLTTIELAPEKVKFVVMAACVLHNYLLATCDTSYIVPGLCDREDPESHTLVLGKWNSQQQLQSTGLPHNNNPKMSAKCKRDLLAKYFISKDGQVPWQWEMI